MSNESLSNKQMDEAWERSEADTAAVLAQNARFNAQHAASVAKACIPVANTAQTAMTKQQMLDRVSLLSSEIDANEEETLIMQAEITALYLKLDAFK